MYNAENNLNVNSDNNNKPPSQVKSKLNINYLLLPIAILSFVIGGMLGFLIGVKSARVDSAFFDVNLNTTPSNFKVNKVSHDEITVDVIDGDVYKILPAGEKQLLFDKEAFRKNTIYWDNTPEESAKVNKSEDQHFEFTTAILSPDKYNILLLGQGSLSLNYLYSASINGNIINFVGYIESSAWSPDGRYIAWLSKPADAGPLVWVNVYDTIENENIDISKNHDIKRDYNLLSFENLRWLDDSSGVKVHYYTYSKGMPMPEQSGEGETVLLIK